MNNKTYNILIIILLVFFSLALIRSNYNFNKVQKLEYLNDSLKLNIVTKDSLIFINYIEREKNQIVINILKDSINTLEKEDSIHNIEYNDKLRKFKKEVTNMTSDDLAKLMNKSYEEDTTSISN